jgi:hypothetical protein
MTTRIDFTVAAPFSYKMVDVNSVAPAGQLFLKNLLERRKADVRFYVSFNEALAITGMKESRLRDLIARDKIGSVVDGRTRKLLVDSLYDWMIQLLIESYPPDGAKVVAPQGKKPSGRQWKTLDK